MEFFIPLRGFFFIFFSVKRIIEQLIKCFMGLDTPRNESERPSLAEVNENPDYQLISRAANHFYAENGTSIYARNFISLVYNLWEMCGYRLPHEHIELFLRRMKEECLGVIPHIAEIPLDLEIAKNMPMERGYAYRSCVFIKQHYGADTPPELLQRKIEKVAILADSFKRCLEMAREEGQPKQEPS